MQYWMLAFVGETPEDLTAALTSSVFSIYSKQTTDLSPKAGDKVLLYIVGEGFVAEAMAGSPLRVSGHEPPNWEMPLGKVRVFEEPARDETIRVSFLSPDFHAHLLTSDFVEMSYSDFMKVLRRTRPTYEPAKTNSGTPTGTPGESPEPPKKDATPPATAPSATERPARHEERTPGRHDLGEEVKRVGAEESEVHQRPDRTTERVQKVAVGGGNQSYEKRVAGQHALSEGRKRSALWTVAEIGASAIKWRGAANFARGKAREAERTWIAGGRAEEKVGRDLEQLCKDGFYVFHDIALPRLGNVDHVVLGRKGFFCIETKSHKGHVSAANGQLLVNGSPTEKDFVKQTWRGCYRLREIVDADVTPFLLFTDAFVQGRLYVCGVRVLPLDWLVGEIVGARERHDRAAVLTAVTALSNATGCHPSSTPRLA